MSGLPGSLWVNNGRWNWRVRLPGSELRRNYPLRLPNQRVAMSADNPRSLAESVAWRLWEVAELEVTGGTESGGRAYVTLNEAVGAFVNWAKSYYRRSDGSQTSEVERCVTALRVLREKYGERPLDDVGYMQILQERDALAERVCRSTVNAYAGVWKRFFAWALDQRLCCPQVKAEVWALSPLKRHRSVAREREPVAPVDHLRVKRTVALLPPVCRAMVLVQELCGARSGELCGMRVRDIDRRRDVWVYRPEHHKTEHVGMPRVIALGPRAQALLAPLLEDCGMDDFVFSPERAQAERMREKRRKRKTAVQPSQVDRRKNQPEKSPGERYDRNSYGRMVRRAAGAAGVECWSPHQLRHACGTRVRRRYGVEAARAVLGHSNRMAGAVTDRYTREAIEKEFVRDASAVMAVMG